MALKHWKKVNDKIDMFTFENKYDNEMIEGVRIGNPFIWIVTYSSSLISRKRLGTAKNKSKAMKIAKIFMIKNKRKSISSSPFYRGMLMRKH